MSIRPVKRIIESKPTMEGAGVKLRRAFGLGETAEFDPFLLLDDFRNDRPTDYQAGFPWHPHRGIETITYVLAGTVDHKDSLGNSGALAAGDVQWMTAGSGILHQEMPKGDTRGRMHGFQLWANLPSSLKMTAPRYQDVVAKDIPEVVDDDGTKVRVICGNGWPSKPRATLLPTCSLVRAPSGMPRSLATYRPIMWDPARFKTRHRPTTRKTDPSCCSTGETKLWCRRATRVSGSCSFRASRSKSRWP